MMASQSHYGVEIAWHDLSVWSKKKVSQGMFKRQKVEKIRLLNSVSGYAKAGSLTAVMGASGAGKTTLLATLSGRGGGFKRHGTVLLNGRPMEDTHMINVSAFMPQHDIVMEELTVLEHMQFMAGLKLDEWLSDRERTLIIDNLLTEMALRQCRSSQLRVLAGGERRRVALAVQLLTDPSVLFCDEPTTGLDSFNASSVVSVLRQLATKGKTVVCTIHQPSSGILENFDEVILMAARGRLAFQGTVLEALQHFKGLGMVCPQTSNTAEFFISQLSVREDFRTEEEVGRICDRFITSAEYGIFRNKFNKVAIRQNGRLVSEVNQQFLRHKPRHGASPITQLKLLLWRHGISNKRNISQQIVPFAAYWFTASLSAVIYRDGIHDNHAVQNIEGMLTGMTSDIFDVHLAIALSTFYTGKSIFLRETKDKMYSVAPYYFSQIMFVLIMSTVGAAVSAFLQAYFAGLPDDNFEIITRIFPPMCAMGMVACALGFCLSSCFESIETLKILMTSFNQPLWWMSGFSIQLSTLPFYIRWLKYISPFYYGNEAISILQWTLLDNIPTTSDLQGLVTPDEVFQKFGFERHNLIFDFIGLAVLFLVLNVVGYIGLKSRSKQQVCY